MDAPPVQYFKTPDGHSMAYCLNGEGTPLVFVPPGFSNVQLVWRFYPDWMEGLASRFRLVQFDLPGEGLSARSDPGKNALQLWARDLLYLTDHLQLDRFVLWAFGPRGHIAVRFALAHPARVKALILHTCAAGNSAWDIPTVKSRNQWEHLLRSLASMNSAGLSQAEEAQLVVDYRSCQTMEHFLSTMEALGESDLTQDLPSLRVPALLLHQREHYMLGPDESIKMTTMIPDARFAQLDTFNLFGNASQGLAAVDNFIAGLPASPLQPPGARDDLSEREAEVLRLLAQGKSNPEIAKELFITRNTVQNHVSSILIKTNLNNRAQAAVYAQQHGIA